MIPTEHITGLILAGGRASRMGGVDKGLQNHRGLPLALHALLRLQPQVGELIINANRNLGAYESFGVPVWPDVLTDFAGPLAGFMAGMEHATTPWLVSVPCDSPGFPDDLVARLAQAASDADAQIAMPVTLEEGVRRTQPVFCLMQTQLLESLVAYTQEGGRKIDAWTAQHRVVEVLFDDARAFFNANTLADLQQLQ
jgi:molybdopterin-guanine dinucleotide biosynthesis protein A